MYPSYKNSTLLISLILFFTLSLLSCKKDDDSNKLKSYYDEYFIGTWQQTRRLDKDYSNSPSPRVTTTHHSPKTPLPKMIFNQQMELITIYTDSSNSFEDIYYAKWEIYEDYLIKDGLSDDKFVKYGADSFIIIQSSYSDYSTQTEWKRIK